MPYDDPDPQDPNVLVGVELPGSVEELRDMAYVFADEFARLGHNEAQIVELFQSPFYAGAYRAFVALGEVEIRAIARESTEAWSGFRVRIIDVAEAEVGRERRKLHVLR